jgi:hypothetical protein
MGRLPRVESLPTICGVAAKETSGAAAAKHLSSESVKRVNVSRSAAYLFNLRQSDLISE